MTVRGSLIEFSFVSRLDASMPSDVVARLVRQIWRHNTAAGITGQMEFRGRQVRQVVEGDVEVVLPLASRILADARHGQIRVLDFGPLVARRHTAWRIEGFAFPGASASADTPSGDTVVALQPWRREAEAKHSTCSDCALSR